MSVIATCTACGTRLSPLGLCVCGGGPRRLTELPAEGKVIIANPRDAEAAFREARREHLDVLLRMVCPVGEMFVLDVDAHELTWQ